MKLWNPLSIFRKEPLVVCFGCFDIFHSTHVDFLREASLLGRVFVSLTSDKDVKKEKGSSRPINNQDQRKNVLDSCRYVRKCDIRYNKTTSDILNDLLEEEYPIIYAKGVDYNLDSINKEERNICEKYGIKIVFLGNCNVSTTAIERKMRNG